LKERLQKLSDNKFNRTYGNIRKEQIGLGLRCEKRRTYRVKDDLVIDHILNKKISLTDVYNGNIHKLYK
jgi:protein subunit release factor A